MPEPVHSPPYLLIDQDTVTAVTQAAKTDPVRRARICLHQSHDDSIQEMLIALCRGTKVRIHRHPGRSESFHVVEGVVEVLFFNDQGEELERLVLGEYRSGYPFLYRLNASCWHSVVPVSEVVIIHETVEGPFSDDSSEFIAESLP